MRLSSAKQCKEFVRSSIKIFAVLRQTFEGIKNKHFFLLMISDTLIITSSAASLGFFHTILGPDHYLPFVAMARTNGWNGSKTAGYVVLCGVSHVLGTILIGLLALLLGFALFKIETFQSLRGDFAGWFLLLFGAVYFGWGINLASNKVRETKNETYSAYKINVQKKDMGIQTSYDPPLSCCFFFFYSWSLRTFTASLSFRL